MKQSMLLRSSILSMVCGFFTANVIATDPGIGVEINIHPGSAPNIINTDSNGVIPVLIFGSQTVDVRKIDLLSLKLDVNYLWCSSQVETTHDTKRKQTMPLCDISDEGSPDPYAFDKLGPPDGHDDLVCHFNKELGLIPEGIQPVTMTGFYLGSDGTVSPLFGDDFASGPAGTQAITRCCNFCFDDGTCSGCNGAIRNCTEILRVCDGDTICDECTGCEPPATS